MSKHTLGPWKVNHDQTEVGNGKLSIEAGDEYFIAQVDEGVDQYGNAKLIAAAPDLLKLLIESQDSIGGDWRARRDAIVAAATGEA